MIAVRETSYHFPKQTGFYRGKVRDAYYFSDRMAVVATDRISAFDVVLPRAIPGKGRILNLIAAASLRATADIVPNWLLSVPHPRLSYGYVCRPYPIEIVVRGYLAGHALREYAVGKRTLCGVKLPDGLKPYDPLPYPIITPTTKASAGHDEDISKEEILNQKLLEKEVYEEIESVALRLFRRGSNQASARGLILADTKYEFGSLDGRLMLIDEVHTPDSSRFFYLEGYEESQKKGAAPKQLSKEFVREWLISQGFQGKEGQTIPEMSDEVVRNIAERYRELYEVFLGNTFDVSGPDTEEENVRKAVEKLLQEDC